MTDKHIRNRHIRTQAIHAGEAPDPITGASAPNLVMSSTFVTDADAVFSATELTAEAPYIYTRWNNPTIDQLERKIAVLENGEACAAFATGMSAITGLFLARLHTGDHLIMSNVAYAGNVEFVHETLPRLGVAITFVDSSDLLMVEAALRPNTKMIYIETPANPIMRLTDIAAIVNIAHKVGAEVAVDSTFATPIATRPIELGADYVIHSLTKYMGGHGDALGGAVVGSTERMNELRQKSGIYMGGTISPFNAWLIMRGLATLPLRMRAHEESALKVAQFLENHPKVTRVMYPGLPSHPQHALAKQQMANFSGMLTFQTEHGAEMAKQLSQRLQVIHYAVSLGHQRSLVFYLSTEGMQESTFRLPPQEFTKYQAFAGEGIFRTSIGIEDADDLCEDLAQALG